MTRVSLPLLESPPPTAPGRPSRALRVALVNMPWARVDSPSIQCGLLQAIARDSGHDCMVHYLNVDLAAELGHRTYDMIAELGDERLHQLGEWLFSFAAFGAVTDESAYFADYPEIADVWRRITMGDLDHLTEFRRHRLTTWLHSCLQTVDWARYEVVGFSSTFLQNTASLALGRLLKRQHPHLTLVYGGANFDSDMGREYARTIDWIDYVVTGEGDIAFPRLLNSIADGTTPDLAGVQRQGTAARNDESPRVHDLDALPTPEYADYFAALTKLDEARVLGDIAVKLPVELSRGCWWGEKHHCTFCGLNGLGMAFRSKSSARAIAELSTLLQRYPAVHIEAVDNILDMKYLNGFCSQLADRRWDISMFYEVKANLTRDQIGLLVRAGIHRIQPGIESLSTHVLQLMRKGATKLINIRLLKWARYHGLAVQWNVLTGFPCETEEDYREQLDLLPLLYHLQPPEGGGRIWLERFSPYFTDPSFPIANVRPRASYRHIYPANLDHGKIAYFFDYEAEDVAPAALRDKLVAAIDRWRQHWFAERKPSLVYQRLPGRMTIVDKRGDQPRKLTLIGWQADAYQHCDDTAHGADRVHEWLVGQGHDVTANRVHSFLTACCRSGVMVAEDHKYLALALPENPGW